MQVFRQVNRAHNRALKPLGISSIQAHILTILWAEAPLTVGDLQRRLLMGSSTLTGAIDRMVKQGLVSREPSPTDRRSFRLHPAPWPEAKREAVLDALQETEDECYSVLGGDRDRLLELLLRVRDNSSSLS